MRRVLDDHYELLIPLHAGGTGILHYGWDLPGQRPVVVREIPTDVAAGLLSDPEALAELSPIAALSHAGIVDVYAVRQSAAGSVYVVASYVDGLDLQNTLRRLERLGKRMPRTMACFIAREILAGLDHLHRFGTTGGSEAGLAHGALRPSRVMLGGQGTPRLTDLVSAKFARGVSGVVPSESVDPREPDILAAGWMLFEMLTGRFPSGPAGESGAVAMRGIEPDELYALEESRSPASIRKIVAEALAPESDLRYPSARSMHDDLLQAMAETSDTTARAETANLVQNLLSEEEDRRRRRLVAMRGGRGAIGEADRIETTDLLAATTAARSKAGVGPDPDGETGPEPLTIARPMATSEDQEALGSPDSVGDPDAWSSPPRAISSMGPELPVRRTPGSFGEARPTVHAAEKTVIRVRKRRIALLLALLTVVIGVTITLGLQREARLPGSGAIPSMDDPSGLAPVLRTVPSGAQVFLNGRLAGETPFPYEGFAPGPLRLRFEYPGLAAAETLIIVREQTPAPLFRPCVLGAEMRFSSIPPGARPIVDGRPLRDIEISAFTIPVTETVLVDFSLPGGGERAPGATRFNPRAGLIPPTDSTVWHWQPGDGQNPPELRVVFSRPVRIHSQPRGALIFLDRDSVPMGRTNTTIDLPYGDHTILLQKEPFLDYRFSLTVAGGTQDLYAPVLKRTVRLGAVRAPARRDS
ncbi:MAG: PEGA domain-containing protein, partial [Acidobacteria bacterium]|nr:PEGA domain-containing protein [Acidobacteriota bacterium]